MNINSSAFQKELKEWQAKRGPDGLPVARGMYDPIHETASCGVGLIASSDGKPRRSVVLKGIEALQSVWHRGAVDADSQTGDGAGIHIQLPETFLRRHISQSGGQNHKTPLAAGQVFLPRTDLRAQESCRQIVEREILREGWTILGWRQVPIDLAVIGEKARQTRPEIEQILITHPTDTRQGRMERNLLLIRRRIERAVNKAMIPGFYLCSLSCRSIIYKGLFLAEQLSHFYPDLQDDSVASNFAIYHQRYSTNTFPSWKLAQPFRVLAHNGEINTLGGNVRWLHNHESRLADPDFGPDIEDIKGIVYSGISDSAALDGIFEVLVRTRRSLPEVKMLLMPEAWEHFASMPKALRDFYAYSHCVMEPWDGPAAICAYSGRWALAGLDRNGLRPLRYHLCKDNLLIVGSESGMVRTDPQDILASGAVQPGGMIAVDLREGRVYTDTELKERVAGRAPYGKWIKNIRSLSSIEEKEPSELIEQSLLHRHLMTVGLGFEDIEQILHPMVMEGKEPTGSMGDDTPLAVLSKQYRPWHHFFRQNFAQVTNPPIDSLRERYVMSLTTRLGNLGNILQDDAQQTNVWKLNSPLLLNNEHKQLRETLKDPCLDIQTRLSEVTDTDGHKKLETLRQAIDRICQQADDALKNGSCEIFLADTNVDANHPMVPMVLAVGALHTYLIERDLRSYCSINVVSAEVLDVHSFAVLVAVGATTVTPWLAQECLAQRWQQGLLNSSTISSFSKACRSYQHAMEEGLLKIMSKMGISVVSSYRGSLNLEAVGLSRALVAEIFPGMPSRISGLGLNGIEKRLIAQHDRAWQQQVTPLDIGGFLKSRQSGEAHAWNGEGIHILQKACRLGAFFQYKKYVETFDNAPAIHLRDLLTIQADDEAKVAIDEVESVTSLRRRFISPGISLGALSPEAHTCLSIAMNRIGARSDSGEGGEDPERFRPLPNGDNPCSAIKQIASGRFGVTTEYLTHAVEIEIKMAQGAKPGEGGQLPGGKVSELIAKLRHSTPGITLISPPPHHDIYSIEDLAQLIYDLKQVNPDAQVCVKLVARAGIGAIASGVAKAHADVILISGHVGGTGASPVGSIKYAGLPWEMGLAEVHQVLTLNNLREKVHLRVDGGIKTGRDIIVGALLGAEEFGIGTAALIAMGCIMVRQCHNNTCPVGICTQEETLRKHFNGKPEHVINLFTFLADDVRHWLSRLGARSLVDIIGRTDLLHQTSRGDIDLDVLDLNALLVRFDDTKTDFSRGKIYNPVDEPLDKQILNDALPLFKDREKILLDYNVRNTQRCIGTLTASKITRTFGMNGLPDGHFNLSLRGTAGQSLGAFAVTGQRIEMIGEANDYVGKGLSGGTIVVRRPTTSKLSSVDHTIIGNTCLYGATAGTLFAAGRAGQRFAVRNSGATALIEGCGDNGCEYMTGGFVLILGDIGYNFAAGMTGGHAIIYAKTLEEERINKESVIISPVTSHYWLHHIHKLMEEHSSCTYSSWTNTLLNEWTVRRQHFTHIVAKDYLNMGFLEHPITDSAVKAVG